MILRELGDPHGRGGSGDPEHGGDASALVGAAVPTTMWQRESRAKLARARGGGEAVISRCAVRNYPGRLFPRHHVQYQSADMKSSFLQGLKALFWLFRATRGIHHPSVTPHVIRARRDLFAARVRKRHRDVANVVRNYEKDRFLSTLFLPTRDPS
ncbi:hypothetical protein LX36DRAFT_258490 [Colletotrichum falcatum]|nr:hypothetical protein LX36DRAFT_258490 [Colletotrichum falcatum]